jgi:hypothetical protein
MTIGVNLPSDSIYNTYSSSRYFVWQSAVTIHIPPRPRSNIRPPIPSSPFHFLLPRIFLLREKVHRKLIQNINNIPNQRTLFASAEIHCRTTCLSCVGTNVTASSETSLALSRTESGAASLQFCSLISKNLHATTPKAKTSAAVV